MGLLLLLDFRLRPTTRPIPSIGARTVAKVVKLVKIVGVLEKEVVMK